MYADEHTDFVRWHGTTYTDAQTYLDLFKEPVSRTSSSLTYTGAQQLTWTHTDADIGHNQVNELLGHTHSETSNSYATTITTTGGYTDIDTD